ncbi:hypothetical protein OE88DRAFT_1617841, partial [Heliocybe sulcata]
ALYAHIRILWRLERGAVPKLPPSDILSDFSLRFSDSQNIAATATAGPPLIHSSLVEISQSLHYGGGGQQAPWMLMVDQAMLEYYQVCISHFGLPCWCPDLRDTAYSPYNSACRIIALTTFQQGILAKVYDQLLPNPRYVTNTMLILKLYDHFVHYYQQKRFTKEKKSPGSVTISEELKTVYKNRERLAACRKKFAKEMKLPAQYINMVSEVKATSDDEWDPELGAYAIKRRP